MPYVGYPQSRTAKDKVIYKDHGRISVKTRIEPTPRYSVGPKYALKKAQKYPKTVFLKLN